MSLNDVINNAIPGQYATKTFSYVSKEFFEYFDDVKLIAAAKYLADVGKIILVFKRKQNLYVVGSKKYLLFQTALDRRLPYLLKAEEALYQALLKRKMERESV